MSVSDLIMKQMEGAGEPRVTKTTQDIKMAEPPLDMSSMGMLMLMMMMMGGGGKDGMTSSLLPTQPGNRMAPVPPAAPTLGDHVPPSFPGAGGGGLMGMDPMALMQMIMQGMGPR